MVETLSLGITTFIATNIDDFFINIMFFPEATIKRDNIGIIIGKYIGMAVLLLISLLAAFGFLQILPRQYLRCLGLVPIFLGIREIVRNFSSRDDNREYYQSNTADIIVKVALITIGNGADNIGVYIPLFTVFSMWQMIVTVFLFFALTFIWCYLGKALVKMPALKKTIERYNGLIVPVAYIALGLIILDF